MKPRMRLFLLVMLSLSQVLQSKELEVNDLSALGPAGEITQFMVLGPIPAALEGFGTLVFSKTLENFAVEPKLRELVKTPLISDGETSWTLQTLDSTGFLDLHETLSSLPPGTDPERVWHARVAYLALTVISESARKLDLLLGTASEAQLFLNGEELWRNTQLRGATTDQNTVPLDLMAGENRLLIKVFQSHHNYGLSFFGGTPWQWGVFARLVDPQGEPARGIKTKVQGSWPKDALELVSTPFFKENSDGSLIQKFLLRVENGSGVDQALLNLSDAPPINLGQLRLGQSVHSLWLPAMDEGGKVKVQLSWGENILKKQVRLKPQRHWELYYIPFSHQDIGYTHTQPVTAEIQSKNLEDVLDYMNIDPDFRWTVETLWQADQLFQRQGKTRRAELMARIKEGRISLSPTWTNSFTGQLSEEEAFWSLEPALQLMQKEGVSFPAFLYNDTPGISWLWPGLLEQMGTHFLFAGINEVYSGYSLQTNLPKLFRWQGGDGSEVVTFISETYNEGLAHGLEKDPTAMVPLIAEQLQRLEDRGWKYDHVALVTSFLDNGGVPKTQIGNIKAWNALFAWPRFVVATAGDYVKKLEGEDLSKLPVLTGDWTSPWETRSQGEPARMLLQREAQLLAPAAEKQNIVNWLEGRLEQVDTLAVQKIYQSLLDYSGHGSGLESGYGSRDDNLLASSYRDQYVRDAWHASHGLAEREMYRLIHATFSFTGQGVLVFNPSSFRRSEMVHVSFGRMPARPLHVVDPRTGSVLPSAWEDEETLVFLAPDLASLGHTKFLLKSGLAPEQNAPPSLVWNASQRVIENAYFRIEYLEGDHGFIKSLYSKEFDQDLLDGDQDLPALSFVKRQPLAGGSFEALPFVNGNLKVVDLRPAGLVLQWKTRGQLAEGFQISIWADTPIIDIQATMNLEALTPPETMEEIGMTLPTVKNSGQILAEVAGGWLNPAESILPGVAEGALSLRHGLLLTQKKHTLAITSLDARVLLSETRSKKSYLPVMNLVNNFPIQWNRNEVNQGSLDFRFQLKVLAKDAQSSDVAHFVASAADPLFIRDSWMSPDEPEDSAFQLSGKSLSIQSIRSSRDGQALILRIKNAATGGRASGRLSSPHFGSETAFYKSDI